MKLFHALILGIVEGISEFLPISSTGHLILASRLLGMPSSEFLKSFEVAIQSGAILAVVALYWRSLLVNFEVMKRVIAAFIPTMVLGLIFYALIKKYLLDNERIVLISLFVGGVLLILFERWHKEGPDAPDKIEQISYKNAILIGVCQTFAMVPGVSRAAMTICGGLALGIKRKTVVEFSFLLAAPTMFAATALDLLKSYKTFSMGDAGALGVGFAASFVTALFAVKFLLKFIQRHNFTAFGWYRMAAALAFALIFLR